MLDEHQENSLRRNTVSHVQEINRDDPGSLDAQELPPAGPERHLTLDIIEAQLYWEA
jgi:hypothetical protein